MNATADRTVRELALEIPGAIRVFERFRIDYCCGGGRSLEEACVKAGADRGEVLAALADSALAAGRPADATDWSTESLAHLVQYIVEKHHTFVRAELPRLQALADKVARVHGDSHPELGPIRDRFRELAAELSGHLEKEEAILFPYVESLERSVATGAGGPAACFASVQGPIRVMMMEHDAAGEILHELRSTSRDFAVPEDACMSYRALYEGIEAFEQDLHRHIHLENNLLFPRTLELEARSDAASA